MAAKYGGARSTREASLRTKKSQMRTKVQPTASFPVDGATEVRRHPRPRRGEDRSSLDLEGIEPALEISMLAVRLAYHANEISGGLNCAFTLLPILRKAIWQTGGSWCEESMKNGEILNGPQRDSICRMSSQKPMPQRRAIYLPDSGEF